MNKIVVFFCWWLVSCQEVQAQLVDRKPENRINISYATQYYFNKSYVVNDNVSPNPLSTNNTVGYNFELAYQHVTSWGLLVTYGLEYGYQQHDVYVNYDVSNFDEEATVSLAGKSYHREYHWKFRYLNQRLMLGYAHALPQKKLKGWVTELKAGVAVKAFSHGDASGEMVYIDYTLDEPNHSAYRPLSRSWVKMGNVVSADGPNKWSANPGKNSFYHTWEGYLGMRKELGREYLKNISIGLEYTVSMYKGNNNDNVTVLSYYKNSNTVSTDYYLNYNKSIGLRIGVGLW